MKRWCKTVGYNSFALSTTTEFSRYVIRSCASLILDISSFTIQNWKCTENAVQFLMQCGDVFNGIFNFKPPECLSGIGQFQFHCVRIH